MGANQQLLAASGAFTPKSVTGLVGWYQVTASTSPSSLTDLSGNGNTLTTGGTAPSLTTNGSVNVLRWNGTTSTPLTHAGDQNFTHVFVTACFTDATFPGYNGLVNSVTGGTLALLLGDGAGGLNTFFDVGYGSAYVYSKNGTVLANNAATAPMSGTLAVLQGTIILGNTFGGGITLCGDRAFGSARYWKGDVANMLIYNNASITAGQATNIRKWCGAAAGGIVVT